MNAIITDGDPQRLAADPAISAFVTANAGSGKTSTLVDRVARLLLDDVEPAQILCVTYTKAAAAEMQARLFERLGKWAVLDDEELREELRDLDGREADDLSKARRLFARALETPGGLKIQTLHAFCEKLLRRLPIEAAVSPRFTVLENQAATDLSKRARDDLADAVLKDPEGVLGEAYAHFAVELDWRSFEALLGQIEADRMKLVDWIERIEAGTAPTPHDLAYVNADETAAEVESGWLNRLSRTEWLAAADGFAQGAVTDQKLAEQMRAACPPDTTAAAMEKIFLDSKGLPRGKFGTKSAPAFAQQLLADLQGPWLDVMNRVRALKVAEDTWRVLRLAGAHATLYELAKEKTGALDFSDLVAKTVELLTERSDAAWVLFKLDGGIEHILVDEAQDTAPDQWDIIRALTEGFFAGMGADRRPTRDGAEPIPRTVFAVGDEKQSIYSFQGARPERLAREAQTYSGLVKGAGRGFEGVELKKSFRSTNEVLAFVDEVFADEESAKALSGEMVAQVVRHEGTRTTHSGLVDLWPLYSDDTAPDRDAWDAPVDEESAGSARKRMARDLARWIRGEVAMGSAVYQKGKDSLRPCGYGDFLVLVRRRDATFEEVIRALKTEGVPVAGADRLKLSEHIAFDDLKTLARFALYPDDDLSLAEILRGPFCDVDEDGLFSLAGARAKRKRLWAELQARADERPEWRRACALCDFAIAERGRDPFAFFSALLNRVDDTGLSGRARVLARLGPEAEEAIDETLNQILSAEDNGAFDLERCLARLEAADVEVKRELEGPRGEVRVMTVHGAKGLEAPIVILPDTTSRAKAQGPTLIAVPFSDDPLEDAGEGWLMCPSSKGDDCDASRDAKAARQARTDAETLRLLYVALTRARDRLVILGRAGSRGPDDGSWWTRLNDAFDALGDQVRTLETGVRRFGADPVTAIRSASQETAAVDIPTWARSVPPVEAGAGYASPSRMEETARAPAPSPLARADGSLGRFRRGDLVHRLLERLPDIAIDDQPAAAVRMLARERDLDEAQRDEMIDAAFRVLNDDRFAAVFGPGSRPEVALVGRAPELPPGVDISGRIDRLVVTPERVLVVDYKSNRPSPDRIEDADPAYVAQMAIYWAVLRALYPDRPVEAALVWTDGPKLTAVPEDLMREALTRLR